MPTYYDSVTGESVNFTVQHTTSKDLSSDITVRNVGLENLSSSFTTQATASLSANFTIQKTGAANLASNITLQKSHDEDLTSSFSIQRSDSVDLPVNFTIRKSDSADVSSSITVRKSASVATSGSLTIRKSATKTLSSSLTVRTSATAFLRTNITIRNKSSAALSTSFWITKPTYIVERIDHNITQMEYGPVSIPTGSAYTTLLEVDVKGYNRFTAIIAAGGPADITYRIQGSTRSLPSVWAGVPSQTDVDVTASDPDNMGTAAPFTGEYERIRIQTKQKSAAGRAVGTIRATRGS